MNETSGTTLKGNAEPKIETKTAMLLWVVIAVVCLILVEALSPPRPAEQGPASEPVPAVSAPAATAADATPRPPKRAEGSPPGYWLYVPQGTEAAAGNPAGIWRYIPYGSEIAL